MKKNTRVDDSEPSIEDARPSNSQKDEDLNDAVSFRKNDDFRPQVHLLFSPLPHYRLRLSTTAVAASSFYPMRGVVPHLVQVEFKNAARNRKRSRRRKASVLYDIRMTEGLLIVRHLFKQPATQ